MNPTDSPRNMKGGVMKIADLEKAFFSIQKVFAEEHNLLNTIESRFSELIPLLNIEAISFCIDNYLTAEMDYHTQGNRGLGRMSDNIPRFGGYFRKPLSSLSQEDKAQLLTYFQDIILRGYLVHALFAEAKIDKPIQTDITTIYEKFIPSIYMTNPSNMGEKLQNVLYASINTAMNDIKSFLDKKGMKGGGFFSTDKTDYILIYYPLAGFVIRAIEVRG